MGFLAGEEALGELGAAGEAVAEIEGFADHDAGFAVGPVGGGAALEGYADAEFERGELGGGGAVVVRVADVEDLAGEDAGAGYGAGVGAGGFGLEDGQDDGVAFDEDFFGVVLVEEFFYGFVEIEAEVGGGA